MLPICQYLSISSVVVFFNNAFSLYLPIQLNVSPDQYGAKCS